MKIRRRKINYLRINKRPLTYRSWYKSALRSTVLLWRKIRYSRWQVRATLIAGTALVLAGVLLLVFLGGGNQTATMQGQNASGPTASASPPLNPPTETPPPPTPTPVQKGVDGPDIAELQQRLMDLGYMDQDEPTEHFGPVTEAALKYFQRQAGLQQDGILGGETKTLLFSNAAKPYTLFFNKDQKPPVGEDVGTLQRRLKELGFSVTEDNIYGSKTVEAVKQFQKMNKLGVDGKAGEETFNRIYSSKATGPKTLQIQLSKNINKFIQIAEGRLGKPYVSGKEGPNSFDCSGLVCYALKEAGVKIGRYTAQGYSGVDEWKKIDSMSDLKKGDLIFFHIDSRKSIGHVGIYIGGHKMIDASSSNGKVVKRDCFTPYWKSHFRLARRPWSI